MLEKTFLYTTFVFLFTTALLKVLALIAGGNYLYSVDRLLDIKNVYILIPAVICEIIVLIMILRCPHSKWTFLGIFFLGAQFVLYRTISALGGFNVTCPCIGNMGKTIGLSPASERMVLTFIAVWMFLGSVLLLKQKFFCKDKK